MDDDCGFVLKSQSKSFQLFARSREERNNWMYLIQASIQHLKPQTQLDLSVVTDKKNKPKNKKKSKLARTKSEKSSSKSIGGNLFFLKFFFLLTVKKNKNKK